MSHREEIVGVLLLVGNSVTSGHFAGLFSCCSLSFSLCLSISSFMPLYFLFYFSRHPSPFRLSSFLVLLVVLLSFVQD